MSRQINPNRINPNLEEPLTEEESRRLHEGFPHMRIVMRLGLKALSARELLLAHDMELSDQQLIVLDQLVHVYDQVQRNQSMRYRSSLFTPEFIEQLNVQEDVRPRSSLNTPEPSPASSTPTEEARSSPKEEGWSDEEIYEIVYGKPEPHKEQK